MALVDGATERPYTNTYQVDLSSTAAENLSTLTISAKKIFSNKDVEDCPTTTKLQFLTAWGEWIDIRDGMNDMSVDTDSDDKFIEFKLD
jgi:hypothetical protein